MNEENIFGNVGVTNTSIGINTLANVTTGIDNTAFGTNTLRYLTTGDGNSCFGYNVVSNVAGNPSLNSAFGTEALESITTGLGNSAFGYQALNNLTTASNNTTVGNLAGTVLTTGSNNTLIGSNTELFSDTDTNTVLIGSGDAGVGTNMFGFDEDVLIGHGIRSGGTCVKVGESADIDEFSFGTVNIGYKAGGTEQFIGRFGDVLIGFEIYADLDQDYFPSHSETVVIGKHAGLKCEEMFTGVIMGYQACQNDTFNTFPTILGTRATQIPLTPNASGSLGITSIGYEAGFNCIHDGDFDAKGVIIGAFAGNSLVEEARFVVLGYESMKNTRGGNNVAAGYRALRGSTSYNDPDAGAGTAVGAGKLTSVMTTIQGTQFVQETVDVDATGATPAGLDGTYFLLSSRLEDYYVWFNVDGTSVDPGPIGSRVAIEVPITALSTPANIVSAIQFNVQFVNPNGDFEAWESNQINIIDVIPTVNGDTTDISAGTAVGDLKLYSVIKLADGTIGTPEMSRIDVGPYPLAEGLSKQYFLISTPTTDYYVWFNNNFNDTDPGPGGLNIPALVGKTGIEVDVDPTALTNYLVGQNILMALNGSGVFIATNPPNICRIINVFGAIENVTLGNNAFVDVTVGSDNVVVGSDAGATLKNGKYNVIVGRNADSAINTSNSTIVGGGASATGNSSVAVGVNSSATANGAVAIGPDAMVAVAGVFQIGDTTVSGAAIMSFGSQIVSDEAWVGGGSTTMNIDNNGNIVRSIAVSFTAVTTNATATSMTSWMISANSARRIQALIVGRRTGGTAGTTNDSGVYRLEVAVKNNGGVITVSAVKEVEQEDQAAWNVAVAEPGVPDGSVHIFVTGAINNNVSWEAKVRTFIV